MIVSLRTIRESEDDDPETGFTVSNGAFRVTAARADNSLRRAAGGHVSTAARRINPLFYTATAQPARARRL